MSASPRPGATSSTAASSSNAKPDRLYIGNLSPTIDEYTLIQVLQKYGSITSLDYMFHKSGALKGKPRGYAFVQFSSKDVGGPAALAVSRASLTRPSSRLLLPKDALKAMVKLHDRLLRGRKLVVTYASSVSRTLQEALRRRPPLPICHSPSKAAGPNLPKRPPYPC
jgi:RNA recognition motif-containing protein